VKKRERKSCPEKKKNFLDGQASLQARDSASISSAKGERTSDSSNTISRLKKNATEQMTYARGSMEKE